MKVEIRTGSKKVRHVDRFGVPGERVQNTVELWVDGICFVHDCDSPEQARALVMRLTRVLWSD